MAVVGGLGDIREVVRGEGLSDISLGDVAGVDAGIGDMAGKDGLAFE